MKEIDKKIWLFGVYCACPLKQALADCPIEEFRKKNAYEKWEYINSLTSEEVDDYIYRHRVCLHGRLLYGKKSCGFYEITGKTN